MSKILIPIAVTVAAFGFLWAKREEATKKDTPILGPSPSVPSGTSPELYRVKENSVGVYKTAAREGLEKIAYLSAGMQVRIVEIVGAAAHVYAEPSPINGPRPIEGWIASSKLESLRPPIVINPVLE